MPTPWTLIERVPTDEGPLELRRRRDEWMISVGGRVLMSSALHRTEDAVATLATARLSERRTPRVLVGGLGLGFTLRAALDSLPPSAEVVVAELHPSVVAWCRGHVAETHGRVLADPRVRVEVADVMDVVRRSRGLDALIVDLYVGPSDGPRGGRDPLYGDAALRAIATALAPGGIYAVWSEDPSPSFEARLRRHGFAVERVLAGRGGPRHAVYLASPRRPGPDARRSTPAAKRARGT